MNIIFIGQQGSGKGTQAELLSKRLKLPIIDVGQIYRDEIRKNTKLGQIAKKYVAKGLLAPEKLTEQLLKKELKKRKYKKGIIFDGFPRDLAQLKFLLKHVEIDYVIQIVISRKESIKRLSSRRICPNCGKIYNLLSHKPKKDMVCDRCGHKVIQRADDYPEAIKKRLKIYHKETLPLLKYFKKENKLIKINGEEPINVVFAEIFKAIK